MYTLTSLATGKVYPDNKQGRAQMDADEGRKRLNNPGMEAMVILMGTHQVQKRAMDYLAGFCRDTGAGRMLKAQIGGMSKSLDSMMRKVSIGQVRTLNANTNQVTVTVSSARVPGCINIDADDLTHIANRALEACSMYCSCTRDESKHCRLRKALENVPSAAVEGMGTDPTRCPYAGVQMEVDEL